MYQEYTYTRIIFKVQFSENVKSVLCLRDNAQHKGIKVESLNTLG